VAGYQASAAHANHAPLSSLELYLLNAYGDIFDLSTLFPPQPGVPPSRLGPWLGGREGGREAEEEEEEEEEGGGQNVWKDRDNDRCSVLIKATEGTEVRMWFALPPLLILLHNDRRIYHPYTLPPSLPSFQGPDVLIGHTTYDYYIVAWPRIVKETVLPSG